MVSLGGLTAYELVISHPDRVRRAVLASADHRNDRPGELDPALLPTQDDFQAMRDAYLATAPGPGAFDTMAQRTSGLVQSFTGWTDDQLRDVRLPVLILVGDTDFIHVENAAETMPFLRRITSPSARSPLASVRAFLHSIMPAPVRSRSCFTNCALISIDSL